MDKLITIEKEIAVLNPDVARQLAVFEKMAKEIEDKEKELKSKILAEMEAHGIIKIETDELTISYVASYDKESFDSKSFKKDNPDLYDEYVKISPVKASVRMKVKECTE